MNENINTDARRLFEEFLDELERIESPNVGDYLARCPQDQQQALITALRLTDLSLNYDTPTPSVSEGAIQSVRSRITKLKRQEYIETESIRTGRSQSEILADVWREERIGLATQIASLPLPSLSQDPVKALSPLLGLSTSHTHTGAPVNNSLTALMRRSSGNSTKSNSRNTHFIDDSWLIRQELESSAIAQKLLDELNLGNVPVNLEHVADSRNLLIREVPLHGLEGCLVSNGEIGAILINKNTINIGRKRFTVAHEIGHFVRHKDKGIFQDTDNELSDYENQLELEANLFASMLLIPQQQLLNYVVSHDVVTLKSGDKIAETFSVSLMASLIRLVRASDHACAFIVSHNGKIKRATKSPHFDGYIEYEKSIDNTSAAAQILHLSSKEEIKLEVPSTSWIEKAEAWENISLEEESRRCENGYVYTLITSVS